MFQKTLLFSSSACTLCTFGIEMLQKIPFYFVLTVVIVLGVMTTTLIALDET